MTPQIEQALAMIHPQMAISLGGGRHMQQLADAIVASALANIRVNSPSELTLAYCQQIGLAVSPALAHYDIAFDGCDGCDAQFNLLKSNGGIFTYERLVAQASQAYVILTSADKVTPVLAATIPLTVEAIDAAAPAVAAVAGHYGCTWQRRAATTYMGYTRTRDGNGLYDLTASNWRNIDTIAAALTAIPGVVATSYCPQLATTVLSEAADGSVVAMNRG
jgi:ribose 5-phosphate isomerase A